MGSKKIIEQRTNEKSIGIQSSSKKPSADQLLKDVAAEDLVKFGFEHEFIGRLPVRVSCESLDENMLYQILKNSEQSIVYQYIAAFSHYGIKVKITDGALKAFAKKAVTQKTGARALNSAFEEALRSFKFELPSSDIKEFKITKELVANPKVISTICSIDFLVPEKLICIKAPESDPRPEGSRHRGAKRLAVLGSLAL